MLARLLEELVYRIALLAHRPGHRSEIAHREATFDRQAYAEWRVRELTSQIERYFSWDRLHGRRVLDFGCGTGALSILAARHGAAQVVGVDLNAEAIELAQQQLGRLEPLPVRFLLSREDSAIGLSDGSFDVILCFDSLEHIIPYEAVLAEWRRVLAPGGLVWIWWSVWGHPYGHHLHTMIPLPWVHLFLSDESLLRICARIYDHKWFRPRYWHLDREGRRKPNPYAGQKVLGDLNKLTIARFERAARQAGFRIARRQVEPFGGRRLARLKRWLAASPLRDYFCACVVYELEKPGGAG